MSKLGLAVKNLNKTFTAVNVWIEKSQDEIASSVRDTAMDALTWIVTHSPQYSGDFAANWKVSINGVDSSFTPEVLPDGPRFYGETREWVVPYRQGSLPAIDYALADGLPKLSNVKAGDYVTISNSASRGDYSYAWGIEDNEIKFRPENVEGGRVIGRYLDMRGSLPV